MSVMRFEEEYKAFNQFGAPMPYLIVRNGSGYLIVDLEAGPGTTHRTGGLSRSAQRAERSYYGCSDVWRPTAKPAAWLNQKP